jgi:hypothetical protein
MTWFGRLLLQDEPDHVWFVDFRRHVDGDLCGKVPVLFGPDQVGAWGKAIKAAAAGGVADHGCDPRLDRHHDFREGRDSFIHGQAADDARLVGRVQVDA